ncbi:MAG: hypothetical protein U5R06_03865 [candidate division KSB1 bacterium]|nr:hypothetical protein [candidate division KSB1 bacterium]
MLSFSSWRLVGSVASIIASQIRGVIINVFFGVRLNAANGISQQVSNQVNNLSVSMTRAIRPQLVKSEGGGDRDRMLRITALATKYSALLFSLFAIPIFFELNYLLKLWLTDVPDYTFVFARLILIGLFVQKLSFEIGTAVSAVGRIKEMTIAESIIMVSGVAFAYFLYTLEYPPETIFVVGIFFGLFTFVARLYYGKKIAGLAINKFLKESFLPLLLPIFTSIIFAFSISYYFEETLLRVIFNLLGAFFLYLLVFRYFSMNKWEIDKFKSLYETIKNKLM